MPILAKGRTVTGRIWTYVRDDRPFGGPDPPAALFYASRDRAGCYAGVKLVLRHFVWRRSDGVEHALTEEFEAGTAVHATLDRLQSADLALGRASRPRQRDGVCEPSDVALQAGGEPFQRARPCCGQPVLDGLRRVTAEHGGQAGCQIGRVSQARSLTPQPLDEGAILTVARIDPTLEESHDPLCPRRPPRIRRAGGFVIEPARPGPTPRRGPRPNDARLDPGAEPVEFAGQLGPITAALGPAPVEIGAVGIDDTRAHRLFPGRWFVPPQPTPYGLAVEIEMARKAGDGSTGWHEGAGVRRGAHDGGRVFPACAGRPT